ncbi:MAG: hypothetical protein ACI841_005159 [Planctomycetota bacterium]|jgi:hypothetical protein
MRLMSNGKVKRSESEWRTIMKQHEISGLSRLAFCQQEQISKPSFDKWKRRLAGVEESKSSPFVELSLPSSDSASVPAVAGNEFEMVFPGGVVLRWKS